MRNINLENVFGSYRGLYQKYSANTLAVLEMVMLGSYFPIIIRRNVPLNNFLSISSYHTTGSTAAAIAPSPPQVSQGLTPLEGQIKIFYDQIWGRQQLQECVSGPLKEEEQI